MSTAAAEPDRHRVIALWGVPRSVSTAFERVMRARGDLEVFHEPFLAFYYHGEERASERYAGEREPDGPQRPEAIRERLLEAASERPVFFKDLAYYLSRRMSLETIAGIESTFLIRHPSLALASLYRLQPDSSFEETGYEAQLELMRLVRESSGEPLVVVDAERLKGDPAVVHRDYCERVGLPFIPEALEWQRGSPSEEWAPWERWHKEAMRSSAIEPPTEEQLVAVESDAAPEGVPGDVYQRCLELWTQIEDLAQESREAA